jgi:hypothetical protein
LIEAATRMVWGKGLTISWGSIRKVELVMSFDSKFAIDSAMPRIEIRLNAFTRGA